METDGASAGIALHDAVSGGLTLNLGVINGDEHRLSLKINYRYPVTKGYADCAPILNGKFASAGFTLDSEVHKAKLYVPADSPLVSTPTAGLPGADRAGRSAKIHRRRHLCQALPNIVAFGPIFPGEEVREHKPDEYISVDSLMRNAQIIAAAVYEMAK